METAFHWPVVEPTEYWKADGDGELPRIPWSVLSPPWQVLLLGDGSPTRQLRLMSSSNTRMELIDVVDVGDDLTSAPLAAARVCGPRIRRRIMFENEGGSALMFAVSWWNRDAYQRIMIAPNLAIGFNISASRVELYREFVDISSGHAPQLNRGEFKDAGELWARSYLMHTAGSVVALIHEVFSPALQSSIGAYRSASQCSETLPVPALPVMPAV
jgi:chorismate lyase